MQSQQSSPNIVLAETLSGACRHQQCILWGTLSVLVWPLLPQYATPTWRTASSSSLALLPSRVGCPHTSEDCILTEFASPPTMLASMHKSDSKSDAVLCC